MPYWDRFPHRRDKRKRDDWLKHLWWLDNFTRSNEQSPRLPELIEDVKKIGKSIQDSRDTLSWANDKFGKKRKMNEGEE